MYNYDYPRAALTVDAIVFVKENNSTYILLIQRGREPYKNRWALPGGFVNMDETLEIACKRELAEETGLLVEKMTQFKTYDAINRDPRHRTISVVFFVELHKRKTVKGGDDAARAEWFSVSDLPKLAFDHTQIISDFFENINNAG
jgi:8-oxo-dGTP diphosphatase